MAKGVEEAFSSKNCACFAKPFLDASHDSIYIHDASNQFKQGTEENMFPRSSDRSPEYRRECTEECAADDFNLNGRTERWSEFKSDSENEPMKS